MTQHTGFTSGSKSGTPSLLDEVGRVKSRVDYVILNQLLPSSSPLKEVDLLYRMMRDYPQRKGKGLRPFFCVSTCKAFGGEESDCLLTAACIELFQNWILIHDDIEDSSELRRGEPTLHRKYDEGLAINAGDALHARMWGFLLRNRKLLGEERTLRILDEFSRMVNETTEGQHMELVWVVENKWGLNESDYLKMVTKKTAWYTVTSPCRLGAIVAGAGEGEMKKLLEFGTKLGMAFQIQDDALNLVGDAEKYGKETSDDILEGKRTLILLRLLEVAESGEREKVLKIMGKSRNRKTAEDVRYVISLMKKHGAIRYSQEKASHLLGEALEVLGTVEWKGEKESVELLARVARYSVERQW